MDMNFELYEEGPVGWTRERVHVTLWKDGHLFFNKWAVEALGNPAGVALMYDKRRQLIGVMPAVWGKKHFHPLRTKKGMGDARIVNARGFCRKFGINPSQSWAFTDAAVNRDGVLVLDLQRVIPAGRNFSPQSTQRAQR